MKSAKDILTSHTKFQINLGLNRMKQILSFLNHPENSFKSVHVAGTNGKGSTCKMINDILTENFKNSDIKVGLYTSPHLFSYTERIKINNADIPEHIFNRLINDIDNYAKERNIELTEFELLTVVAFYYFYIKKVDWAVIEVGLGGKYDATNLITPVLSVITSISLDHTERLGDTIGKIALEKAGIIKPNTKTIVSENNLGYDVIKKVAEKTNSQLIDAEDVPLDIDFAADFQKENFALAYYAIKNSGLNITDNTIKNALKNFKWKFRTDYDKEKNLLIDGAHNPAGMKVLRQYLDKNFKNEKNTIIFGCLKNKDYKNMLDILLNDGDDFYFYEFDYPNALKFDELPEKYKQKAKKLSSKKEVIELILKIKTLKTVCGSLYMLGNIFK